MSYLDDLKTHYEAVKAWVIAMDDHLWHRSTSAPPPPPVPPKATVVESPVASADNSADDLNKAELESLGSV